MIGLNISKPTHAPLHVLCLGAHADDIEIGCGGTLLQLKERWKHITFHWVVFSADGIRLNEAREAASLFTANCECIAEIKEYRDSFMSYYGASVKEVFEDLKKRIDPDLVFTHWQGDAHQDHRLIAELTWNTFRNNLILEYEIPKYDGDLGRPNVFIHLTLNSCEEKVSNLLKVFKSQRPKSWFSAETFLGLMRLRGIESNSASGYAEAFYARKVVLTSLD